MDLVVPESKKYCLTCVFREIPNAAEPCRSCNDKSNWKALQEEEETVAPNTKYHDGHYQTAHQPLETMQANMTNEEFIGFLKGNIIKYTCRCGRKDDALKEAEKIARYAEWLVKAIKNEIINPRED